MMMIKLSVRRDKQAKFLRFTISKWLKCARRRTRAREQPKFEPALPASKRVRMREGAGYCEATGDIGRSRSITDEATHIKSLMLMMLKVFV
jgi:hypothetical protein